MLKNYENLAKSESLNEVEIKAISTFSQPGIGLVKEAEAQKKPLLVIGTSDLTRIKKTLLGSVAEYVVKNAHCDVHVVRH